ncbi:MAG: Tad domain-containing protein [Myxococcus sp.]|nr:Tad domain-containing protein [Myxococcus sp.]
MNSTKTLASRRRRGQTMVLAVVTMLVLALMMVIGFNIAHTAHERIRVQQAADAQAFSVAVLQARAMNVNAVLNRTIAALTVAQMSLHAWNTIATHEVDMLNAGFFSFLGVSAWEAGKAKCSKWTPWHCWDAIEALLIAFDYLGEKGDYEDKLESKEQQFNEAVKALYDAKKSLYDQELNLVNQIKGEINGGSILKDMLKKTAPQAKYATGVDSVNVNNFLCTLDGPDDVGACSGSEPLVFQRARPPPSERSRSMENAANAARGLFNKTGGGGATLDHADFKGQSPFSVRNPPKMMDIQSSGTYQATYIPGAFASRVGDSEFSKSSDNGELALNVGSATGFGFVNVRWRHGRGAWFLGSSVFSSQGGGEHTGAVGDNHSEFKTIANITGEATFISFNGHTNPTADNDWGQPNAYGAVTQDLRLLQKGGKGAFEVNKTGTINIRIGQEQRKITLVSQNEGVAVGKAKAYFHQLGADWKLPPNGFDPFWRAKLHPFKRDELRQVLNLAGDPNANVQGPVEGVE